MLICVNSTDARFRLSREKQAGSGFKRLKWSKCSIGFKQFKWCQMAQNVANDHFKVSAEENELYLFDQLIYLPYILSRCLPPRPSPRRERGGESLRRLSPPRRSPHPRPSRTRSSTPTYSSRRCRPPRYVHLFTFYLLCFYCY